jgi:hypothetical protein
LTDYDRLCAVPGPAFLHGIGGVQALAISDGSDSFAWSVEAHALLANLGTASPLAALAACSWTDLFRWQIGDGDLVLMNSAVHGAQLAEEPSEFLSVSVVPATYRVRRAEVDAVGVYQLVAD